MLHEPIVLFPAILIVIFVLGMQAIGVGTFSPSMSLYVAGVSRRLLLVEGVLLSLFGLGEIAGAILSSNIGLYTQAGIHLMMALAAIIIWGKTGLH